MLSIKHLKIMKMANNNYYKFVKDLRVEMKEIQKVFRSKEPEKAFEELKKNKLAIHERYLESKGSEYFEKL